MGTIGYMAPEQVRGQAVDHRADIFALGAVLYEMIVGRRAFERSSAADIMSAILNEDPPGISQAAQTAAPGLQRVVHRCLDKDPGQRFQSASDLAFALEALSDSGISSAPAVVVPVLKRLRPALAWSSGLVVVLAGYYFATRHHRVPSSTTPYRASSIATPYV
jgi:serine/threonine protein kinase